MLKILKLLRYGLCGNLKHPSAIRVGLVIIYHHLVNKLYTNFDIFSKTKCAYVSNCHARFSNLFSSFSVTIY